MLIRTTLPLTQYFPFVHQLIRRNLVLRLFLSCIKVIKITVDEMTILEIKVMLT